MPKKVAMIPLLLESTRIKDKNLLLVNGQLLVYYVIDACKKAGVFDEIYINSPHDIFKGIADKYGVKFYKRSPKHGGLACTMKSKSRTCNGDRCQTHDHFLYDFMKNVGCEHLFLVHTTSPLMTPQTIKNFVEKMEQEKYDSMFSVIEEYVESYVDEKPVNFDPVVKVPTQSLNPIQLTSWALTCWKTKSFMDSYERDDPKEQGPTYCGKVGLFPINKIEGLDIDNWEELYLVEAYLSHRHTLKNRPNFYYSDQIAFIDSDVEKIMKGDGVAKFEGKLPNQTLSNLDEIKNKMGKAPWSYLLVYSDSDQAALICQGKEEGCRYHYHATKDEWWIVLEGSFDWHIKNPDGSEKVISTKKNDVVFLPKGTPHMIVCTSKEPGIRLAHGSRDMPHIYLK
ncbi:MAG TPA: cupin domain-containing protein [archaeon]|nr:cupin domain-containing protein [archaeon]